MATAVQIPAKILHVAAVMGLVMPVRWASFSILFLVSVFEGGRVRQLCPRVFAVHWHHKLLNFTHMHTQDPAVIASKAVEERVRRLEIQVNNFDKGMAKCLSQIVRLLQGLY